MSEKYCPYIKEVKRGNTNEYICDFNYDCISDYWDLTIRGCVIHDLAQKLKVSNDTLSKMTQENEELKSEHFWKWMLKGDEKDKFEKQIVELKKQWKESDLRFNKSYDKRLELMYEVEQRDKTIEELKKGERISEIAYNSMIEAGIAYTDVIEGYNDTLQELVADKDKEIEELKKANEKISEDRIHHTDGPLIDALRISIIDKQRLEIEELKKQIAELEDDTLHLTEDISKSEKQIVFYKEKWEELKIEIENYKKGWEQYKSDLSIFTKVFEENEEFKKSLLRLYNDGELVTEDEHDHFCFQSYFRMYRKDWEKVFNEQFLKRIREVNRT